MIDEPGRGVEGDEELIGGVQLRADPNNAGTIYVGAAATVTADATATGGYPLAAGEGVFIPIDDLAKVWVIATVAAQNMAYLWV